jgi:hypothetical protein
VFLRMPLKSWSDLRAETLKKSPTALSSTPGLPAVAQTRQDS